MLHIDILLTMLHLYIILQVTQVASTQANLITDGTRLNTDGQVGTMSFTHSLTTSRMSLDTCIHVLIDHSFFLSPQQRATKPASVFDGYLPPKR